MTKRAATILGSWAVLFMFVLGLSANAVGSENRIQLNRNRANVRREFRPDATLDNRVRDVRENRAENRAANVESVRFYNRDVNRLNVERDYIRPNNREVDNRNLNRAFERPTREDLNDRQDGRIGQREGENRFKEDIY